MPIMKTVKFEGGLGSRYHGIIIADLKSHDPFVKIILRFNNNTSPSEIILKNRRTLNKMKVISGSGPIYGKDNWSEKGPAQIEINVATQSGGIETADIVRFFIEFGKLLEELLEDADYGLYRLEKRDLRRWTRKW